MLVFEWDAERARQNEQKHGVPFVEAAEVFHDDHSSTVSDPGHSIDEGRYLTFGIFEARQASGVSYTERGNRIRLISARQMTARERRACEG